MLAKKTVKRHVQLPQTFSRTESDTKHKVMKDLNKGCLAGTRTGPKVIKVFFLLNSAENEVLNAHKYKSIYKFSIFQAQISLERYFSCS